MQTLRKKTSPCKYRNDPGRFFGDGVTFKAKLIGILEVGEARGDRMCQEALQDLKMAIRAAGEHKQRITIHVTIDGLRLRDEKTGDSLYHHPVHKISFIAQDMTDSRAFGYIFGSPDSGHRFFGIKTDKAASQVVLAMRDLFQVVFELKKKEIEMARQQIQSKIIHEHQPITLNVKSTGTDPLAVGGYGKTSSSDLSKPNNKEMSPESVADLVDLEQELSSIQRGITQMERITPSEPTAGLCKGLTEEDPFGDSFTAFPTYQLLPPPESSRTRHKANKMTESTTESSPPISSLVGLPNNTVKSDWLEKPANLSSIPFDTTKSSETSAAAMTTTSTTTTVAKTISSTEDPISAQSTGSEDLSKLANASTSIAPEAPTKTQFIDAFTDLDPLGTGKSRPYVDKKYFFHELKNPPKKVLKDLSGQKDTFTATFRENDSAASDKDDVFDLKDDVRFDVGVNMDGQAGEHGLNSLHENTILSKDLGGHNEKMFTIDFGRSKVDEPIMMKRDTDPFSPTRKKSDPFQEGDIFNKLDPFEFEFANKQTILPETKIVSEEKPKKEIFNGPLQVNLPPENWNSTQKRIVERQTSESPTSSSRNRPSVFKQNTVDVISSISSKKMPHLFGSTKFSKRDSNSINMRRLQESDSLSENETAPEPPPRPDSLSHIEPPPLPPKKQFTDIVIRPRITSSSAVPPPIRYDYVTAKMKQHQSLDSAPPIPLPSRKVGRTDSSYPGPGRPGRKPGDEEDYLTPIGAHGDVPPLLPPPQTKGRGRRYEYLDKTESEASGRLGDSQTEPAIPDITLSQLLTLGIDDLAAKLNVPTTKLSTMTLVELTSYLSKFIENSKRVYEHVKPVIAEEASVFKVNFDQNPEATFVAKFDDNFGEESAMPFVADFSDFEAKHAESRTSTSTPAVSIPPADRYAAFREIMELDKQDDDTDPVDSSGQEDDGSSTMHQSSTEALPIETSNIVPVAKIDTKITEAISHAKDRYAALRDIILVEDLFEKPPRPSSNLIESDDLQEDFEDQESFERATTIHSNGAGLVSSDLERSAEKVKNGFSHTLTVSNNDDLEIDEYMHRAISNLSLDSRGGDRLTPCVNKSPNLTDAGTSPKPPGQDYSRSPITPITHEMKSQFNDMSTSPIPLQKLPNSRSPLSKSPLSKSPLTKSPIPQSPAITSLIEPKKRPDSGSMSDIVCESSPETDRIAASTDNQSKVPTSDAAATESWAIFEKIVDKKSPREQRAKVPKGGKELPESPCSSDPKDEWKREQEYVKKWPKGQTSSSSRDLSPWDDETSDYKKRPPPDRTDRHGYYMRHARRMNSCDDDYDYDEEVSKRRDRRPKGHIARSRENFDSDSQNWYHSNNHHHWSPPEDDEGRSRAFDRNLYERGTYGPPLRDHKTAAHLSHDRRDYKNYDKRKYYREYSRPDYDFEPYGESPDVKDRKMIYYTEKSRRDYENMYEEGFVRDARGGSKSRDFYYERDRKSFDRDSIESYDSATRRQRSFGSGDVYGSLDSREEFRERYMGSMEKARSLRKPVKMRSNEEYEPDSENGEQVRRGVSDTRSLQRPTQSARMRKSSGSSPWDGEEPVPGPVPISSQKGSWKRPSSASESERRLAENRRVLCHTLSGSDGEKDKRFRRRSRGRKEEGGGSASTSSRQQNFGTYHRQHRDEVYDYIDYDEYGVAVDEDKFERLNRRRQDMHQRMMDADRRKKPDKFTFDDEEEIAVSKYATKKEIIFSEKDRHIHKFDVFDEPPPKSGKSNLRRPGFDFDDFEETPRSNASSSKFNFEEHGFESDFNSPPATSQLQPIASSAAATISSTATKSSFRFSNDFSDKEHKQNVNFESEVSQIQIQKLRFDDNVTISKFENEKSVAAGAFEDDFSKAEFVLETEDRWTSELPKRNNTSRLPKRQEQIKKSESVNIFGKKVEDPFEDDDFFKSSPDKEKTANGGSSRIGGVGGGDRKKQQPDGSSGNFNWDNNFAKFDENM